MEKKLKSSTNNQWISLPEDPFKEQDTSNKKDKTATDNQWTSTAKNNTTDQK